jgi:regulator of RNase E activity RraA
MNPNLTPEMLRRLADFDTCLIANAIESHQVRLRNEGFGDSSIACRTPRMPPMVGVAVTLKVRSADPSMKDVFYLDQPDWWEKLDLPPSRQPRVLAIEDTDHHPGRGALVGPFHACILKALGCVGVVTNGAVRGLDKYESLGLQAFSGNVSPSHAYGHVVALGLPVQIAGVRIEPGEIIHGDRHGFVTVPSSLAEPLPETAERLRKREKRICDFCASPGFSPAALRRLIDLDAGRS